MKQVASEGRMKLLVLTRAFVTSVGRRARKQFSILHNPLLSWVASQAAGLRRRTLRRTTVIGITGSCGKTTTTLLAGAILSAKSRCDVQAVVNTHEVAIRSLWSIDRSTCVSVHEVAASKPGSVARTVKTLMPQIGVVTMIGTDHYSSFRGLEGVAREKAALIEALPRSGTAILNLDDPHVRVMTACTGAKILTFGRDAEADVRATDVSSSWPDHLSLTVGHAGQAEPIRTRLVGEHWVPSVLAAISCGIAYGLTLRDCARAIEASEPFFGRYSEHRVPGGPVYVFDHKASYWTIASGLDFVRKAHAPRKSIVFGTISDHPGSSSSRYRRVARDALQVADRVVFVGPRSRHAEKARTEDLRSRLLCFLTAQQASHYLGEDSLPGELILIKSSMVADHLERIFLSHIDQVVCWRERCGRHKPCPDCSAYRKPWPRVVAEVESQISEMPDDAGSRQHDHIPVSSPTLPGRQS